MQFPSLAPSDPRAGPSCGAQAPPYYQPDVVEEESDRTVKLYVQRLDAGQYDPNIYGIFVEMVLIVTNRMLEQYPEYRQLVQNGPGGLITRRQVSCVETRNSMEDENVKFFEILFIDSNPQAVEMLYGLLCNYDVARNEWDTYGSVSMLNEQLIKYGLAITGCDISQRKASTDQLKRWIGGFDNSNYNLAGEGEGVGHGLGVDEGGDRYGVPTSFQASSSFVRPGAGDGAAAGSGIGIGMTRNEHSYDSVADS